MLARVAVTPSMEEKQAYNGRNINVMVHQRYGQHVRVSFAVLLHFNSHMYIFVLTTMFLASFDDDFSVDSIFPDSLQCGYVLAALPLVSMCLL